MDNLDLVVDLFLIWNRWSGDGRDGISLRKLGLEDGWKTNGVVGDPTAVTAEEGRESTSSCAG